MKLSDPVDTNIVSLGETNPDKPAVADHKLLLTFGELSLRIRQVANLLTRNGLEPNGKVIILMSNSVDQIVSHLAVLWAGGVSVPLPTATPIGKLEYCYSETGASLMVADTSVLETACKVVGEKNRDRIISRDRSVFDGVIPLNDAYKLSPAPRVNGRSMGDVACLMYTTGSTGSAKAVVITHQSLMNSLRNIISYLGYDGSQKEAVVLPLTHSFGLGHVYCCLLSAGFCWVDDGLKRVKRVLDALEKYEINGLPASPSLIGILTENYGKYFLEKGKTIRYLVINSAPLPPEQAKRIIKIMPAVHLYIYYGLTEASRSTFIDLSQEAENRYQSVGPSSPNVEVAIFSTDGCRLTTDEAGEVYIRGDHIAKGYWKKDDETDEVFVDGWVKTGDLGSLDEEGYLTLHGRIKEQINVGGLKVLPAEVEKVIAAMPGIEDVAVAEAEDPAGIRGVVVGAVVVASDSNVKLENIKSYCSASLDNYMVPEVAAFCDSIPRAESGKILRGEVRELLKKRVTQKLC